MIQALRKVLWSKIILEDPKNKWDDLVRLYWDNKSAVNLDHNMIQHNQTKHIQIDRHFTKQRWREGGLAYLMRPHMVNVRMYSLRAWVAKYFRVLHPSWDWRISIHQLEGGCGNGLIFVRRAHCWASLVQCCPRVWYINQTITSLNDSQSIFLHCSRHIGFFSSQDLGFFLSTTF